MRASVLVLERSWPGGGERALPAGARSAPGRWTSTWRPPRGWGRRLRVERRHRVAEAPHGLHQADIIFGKVTVTGTEEQY